MPASSPHSALIIGASRGLGRAFQSCEDDAVDGRNCANSGRSPAAWPTGHIDPKRAFPYIAPEYFWWIGDETMNAPQPFSFAPR